MDYALRPIAENKNKLSWREAEHLDAGRICWVLFVPTAREMSAHVRTPHRRFIELHARHKDTYVIQKVTSDTFTYAVCGATNSITTGIPIPVRPVGKVVDCSDPWTQLSKLWEAARIACRTNDADWWV